VCSGSGCICQIAAALKKLAEKPFTSHQNPIYGLTPFIQKTVGNFEIDPVRGTGTDPRFGITTESADQQFFAVRRELDRPFGIS